MESNNLGKASMGMEANIAALLSYFLGFITGILFYVLEKENKFVRFHAMAAHYPFEYRGHSPVASPNGEGIPGRIF